MSLYHGNRLLAFAGNESKQSSKGCFGKPGRRHHKVSRTLAKAVVPISLKNYERDNGKISLKKGGILLFIRDMNPAALLAKFREEK